MSERNIGRNSPAGAVSGGQQLAGPPEKEKLSKFLVVNIYILIIMGLGSGLLLLFGEFEGKFIRVFSTLFLFVIFTAFVAKDTGSNKPFLGVPIALAGNIYLLALSLMLIWGTLGKQVYGSYDILPKLLIIILAVKLATFVVQKVSYLAYAEQPQLSLAGKLTAGALAITALFYTIPVALDHLFNFGDVYWKLAVFSIIVSGLGISIASLLFWNFRDRINPLIAGEFGSMAVVSAPQNNSFNRSNHSEPPKYGQRAVDVSIPASEVRAVPYSETLPAEQKRASANHPVDNILSNVPKNETVVPPVAAPPMPPTPPVKAPEPAVDSFAPQASAPLPWPVYPDGSPIPAKQDGSPDFAALEAVNEYIRQQYGKH